MIATTLLVMFALIDLALMRGSGRFYFGALVSDLVDYFYPHRVFVSRCLGRGCLPFWNMHCFGGYPVAEVQQMALFHPVSLVAAWQFSPEVGLGVWMAALLSFGAAWSYISLRRTFRWGPFPASVAVGGYFFGAVMATRAQAGHFSVVGAVALWMPAVAAVWQIAHASSQDVTRRASVAPGKLLAHASLVNALVVLAGAPQYVAYLFYVELVVVLAVGQRLGRALVGLVIAWVLAAAASAPQWFPTLFYLPFTGRARGASMAAPSAADLLNGILELFLPFPLGDDLSRPHMHMKNVWETATYPGTLVLVLAAFSAQLALRKPSRPVVIQARMAWAIIGLGLYLCAGGWLPGFASFREAMKARAILALGVALAAGVGTQRLGVTVRLSDVRVRFRALLVAILAAGLLALSAWGAVWLLPLDAPRVGSWVLRSGPPIDALRAAAWHRALAEPHLLVPPLVRSSLSVALWATAALGLLGALLWSPGRRNVWLLGLTMGALLDPFSVHYPLFVARHPYAAIGLPNDFSHAMQTQLQRDRTQHALPWRVTLPPSLANRGLHMEGLWETGGYDPLMPREANNRVMLATRQLDIPVSERRTTIALALGRRYDFTAWHPEFGEALNGLARFEVAPHASLVSLERRVRIGQPEELGFGPELETGVHYVDPRPRDPDGRAPTDPTLVERLERIRAQALRGGSPDFIRPIFSRSPNEFAFRVRCGAPALLVFRTTWLPGWRARIDDQEFGRPWCANGWMLAVPLETGSHTVRFRYRPEGFEVSMAIALASWALLLGAVACGGRCRSRSNSLPHHKPSIPNSP